MSIKMYVLALLAFLIHGSKHSFVDGNIVILKAVASEGIRIKDVMHVKPPYSL